MTIQQVLKLADRKRFLNPNGRFTMTEPLRVVYCDGNKTVEIDDVSEKAGVVHVKGFIFWRSPEDFEPLSMKD